MNSKRKTLVSISVTVPILACLALLLIPGQGRGVDSFASVSSAMQECIAKQEVAGVVTLVATRDKVLHLEAAGRADIAAKTPMRTDSIFWIASMTKPITATAVLMLQEEGKLSVDDPVAKYLPELGGLQTPAGETAKLTLRHLLTHTSGMPEATADQYRDAKSLAEVIPFYAGKSLKFEPGSKWQYCQSGINSLGRIVEVVSGQSFPAFLQKRLFDPLGMKDTTFYLSPEQLARLARTYRRTGETLEEAPISFLNGHQPTDHDRYPAPNGGLFSTASDYARFCRMILNQGALDGKRYLEAGLRQTDDQYPNGRPQDGLHGRQWLGFGLVCRAATPGHHGHAVGWRLRPWRGLRHPGMD